MDNTNSDHQNRFMGVSEAYDRKIQDKLLQNTKEEIRKVEKEMEKMRLEHTWCFDSDGCRTVPSVEQQAWEISKKISEYPFLREDIVKALMMKKVDLMSNLKDLEKHCRDLSHGANR